MLNYLIMALIGAVAVIGSFLPQTTNIWDDIKQTFGTTNFPTSLDTLTNPSGTDSVATVSHSSQHSNANDAIEAIEAKIGIGAFTPSANTIMAGNGSGSSIWSSSPTSTNIYALNNVWASGLGTFGTLLSQGSTTVTSSFRLPSISQGLGYVGSTGLINSTPTTTASCSGAVSCSDFTIVGSSPVTISAAAGSTVVYHSTTTSDATSLYIGIGPISVTAGDQFLIMGAAPVTNGEDFFLEVKPTTYAASTTLGYIRNSSGAFDWFSTTGYYLATTTLNVYFNLRVTGGSSDSVSIKNLTVIKF